MDVSQLQYSDYHKKLRPLAMYSVAAPYTVKTQNYMN
jgi:hypothetical protein